MNTKNRLTRFTTAALVVLATLCVSLASCGSDNDPEPVSPPGAVRVTGVSLNKPLITPAIGGSETLTAIIVPDDADNKKVTWSSDNKEVATVDASGKVTGVKAGSTTITVTTEDGGKTASCLVAITASDTKMVSVGDQTGTLTTGKAGTVTFPIMAVNMANGSYAATVTDLPAGVTAPANITVTDNAATLTLSSTTTISAGTYSTLTLKLGEITSNVFMLTIDGPPGAPVITAHPTDVTVELGATAKFTVAATGEGLTYKWEYSIPSIDAWTPASGLIGGSGATTAEFSLANARALIHAYRLRCEVSNAAGSMASAAGTLILAGSEPAVITKQPESVSIQATQTATFTVEATGTGLTYQWQHSSNGRTWLTTTDNTTYSGTTTPTLTVTTNETSGGTISYRCQVGNVADVYTDSDPATLTIAAVGAKTVTVRAQVSELRAGVATIAEAPALVGFRVSTTGIGHAKHLATVSNLPVGVSVYEDPIYINEIGNGTLYLKGSLSTVAGTYSGLRLTIKGTQSAPFTLRILEAKTVSVGAQQDPLKSGSSGWANFPVTTTGIAPGSYTVSLTGLPAHVTSLHDKIYIDSSGNGTLMLWTEPSAVAGTSSAVQLSINGARSAPFTLTIDANPKSVTMGPQTGKMIAGTDGSTATYMFQTTGIDAGSYTPTVANLPEGVSVQGGVTITGTGHGALTLRGSTSTIKGTYNNLALTLDGITSAPFTLAITGVVEVVINGVTWATSNLAEPGTFAANPESGGRHYQWGHPVGWSLSFPEPPTPSPSGYKWDSIGCLDMNWEPYNDPCPTGWRVPTLRELEKLLDHTKVGCNWTQLNGSTVYKFTDKSSGESIFLPTALVRSSYTNLKFFEVTGFYWCSETNQPRYPKTLLLLEGTASITSVSSYYAASVRCVRK